MNGYGLTVTCPHCGGPVVHEASGIVLAGTETRAACRCSECGRRQVLEVFLRDAPDERSYKRRAKRHAAVG